MPVRNRSWSRTIPKGTGHWQWGGDAWYAWIGGSYPIVVESNSCDDNIHVGDNSPFHVHSYKCSGGLINGNQPDSTVWSNYLADWYSNPGNFQHVVPYGSPDNIAAATDGARRTNPSRPESDIPANLAQLGDITQLLQREGHDLISRIGGDWLKYQFAIKPVVDDLSKLFDLKRRINNRVQELVKLHQTGLRRTVTVFTGSSSFDTSGAAQSNFGWFYTTGIGVTSEVVRVHCRWKPATYTFPWETRDDDLVHLAQSAILGDTFDLSTLWQATPWSWLIDWTSTAGNYLAATRNVVGAILDSVSVLRHRRTEFTYAGAHGSGDSYMDPCKIVLEDKDRALSAVFPEAYIPFLSESDMGIVSALGSRRGNPLSLRS